MHEIVTWQCAGRRVKQLAWSPDSALLAVMMVPLADSEHQASVQVWTRSNWHWYLKMERLWPHRHAVLQHMEWHSMSAETNGCLVICDDCGHVEAVRCLPRWIMMAAFWLWKSPGNASAPVCRLPHQTVSQQRFSSCVICSASRAGCSGWPVGDSSRSTGWLTTHAGPCRLP